jgi:hypothetical protein
MNMWLHWIIFTMCHKRQLHQQSQKWLIWTQVTNEWVGMDRNPCSVYSSYMFLWSFVLTFDIRCESSYIHYFYVEIFDSVYVVLFFKSHIRLLESPCWILFSFTFSCSFCVKIYFVSFHLLKHIVWSFI